jgi:glycosyltransferase involved in cell wall biosynthesis
MTEVHDPALVSVLVTVYNREAYLAACLDSILTSTWEDFEVVVVDDGSSDGSLMIAEAYATQDPRIRFYRNERNLGDYPNRLRAAELARGKYLKYVDSDDLIYRHSLAIMVEAMEAYPDAVAGLCHSRPEDDKPYPWLLQPRESWHKQFLGRGCMSAGPSSAILRRDAFFAIGGFRSWGVLNDTDLWFRLSAAHPILLLPPGLIWWRRHEGQEFTRDDASIVYLERGFELLMETLHRSDCPLSEDERKRAIAKARQHHSRRLWSLALMSRRPGAALRMARRAGVGVHELINGLKSYS